MKHPTFFHLLKLSVRPSQMKRRTDTEKELEILRLKEKVRCLEETVQQQNDELKEATKLLIKTRPHPRPPIPHDKKLLIAAAWHFKCSNPFSDCPLWRLSDGTFDSGLFEIDHIVPLAQCYKTVNNLRPVCSLCHSRLTREERLKSLETECESGEK